MPLQPEYVILHCTDAPWGNVASVRAFHVGVRGWKDIGYAYLIENAYPTWESYKDGQPIPENDGNVSLGRDLDHDGDVDEEVGAHVEGWNNKSIGVAMVGAKGRFTGAQLKAAIQLCRDLCYRHELSFLRVLGHYETGAKKTCPDLDMAWFRERMLTP
jgi:hypothetical protein